MDMYANGFLDRVRLETVRSTGMEMTHLIERADNLLSNQDSPPQERIQSVSSIMLKLSCLCDSGVLPERVELLLKSRQYGIDCGVVDTHAWKFRRRIKNVLKKLLR